MRKILLLSSILLWGLYSCTNNTPSLLSKFANTGNLPTQKFTVNTLKDTVITTAQGIIVSISSGSIKSSATQVTLTIQEALSIEDILNAGLATQTDKQILSSDGMFNIQTLEPSTIVKPLDVKLPTNTVNPNMQLYTGKEKNDKIIWQNPKPIAVTQKDSLVGETLFNKYCSSCHALDKELTATALANVETRWDKKENLVKYILNSQKFLHDNYASAMDTFPKKVDEDVLYAGYMHCKNNHSAMNVFEEVLTEKDIEDILIYIKQNGKIKPNYRANFNACQAAYKTLRTLINKKAKLITDNGEMAKIKIAPTTDTVGNIPKVGIKKYNAEYYSFKVEGLGWHNIDELLNNPDNILSKLFVNINATATNKFEVYFVIPDKKVLAQGGSIDNEKLFVFYELDGSVYLPQEQVAYIFAVGEEAGKTYFGKTMFTTSTQNNISLNITEVNPKDITSQIQGMALDGLNFKIEKTKNFENQKAIDKTVDSINMVLKNNCGCYSYSFQK